MTQPIRSIVFIVLVLAACGPSKLPSKNLRLAPVSFSDLPGWSLDNQAEALPSLRRSCEALPDFNPKLPQALNANA